MEGKRTRARPFEGEDERNYAMPEPLHCERERWPFAGRCPWPCATGWGGLLAVSPYRGAVAVRYCSDINELSHL